MVSHGFSLVRLRPFASTASPYTPSRRLPSALIRPIPISSPRMIPRPSSSLRAFSQTASFYLRPDPRHNPNHVDYDASLGDPWYHYRLRTAKPLITPTPPPPAANEPPRQDQHRPPGRIRHFIRSTRTRTVIGASILAAVCFYWYNIEIVPVSGRKRFNCYSEATVLNLAKMQYDHLLEEMAARGETFLPAHDRRVRQVRRVLAKLVPVAGMENADWEVHVVNNLNLAAANAFVLPGGKVFVHSGLLRIAQTDAQLAAVLGHEIAHNLARHLSERLSAAVGETFFFGSTLMLLAATPLSFILGYFFGGQALNLLFSRPMGRMQESEADYIGLMMMAEACYDPHEAVTFWARMDQVHREAGMEVPEWMSTHPSSGHRIERINKWLPEALEKNASSDCVGTQGFAESFRRAMERSEVFSRGM